MTTCDPPLALFRRQIESIRAQTHADWVCVISDDCSQPERFAAHPGGARRRPALPALARLAAGSASIATSSARWRWRPPAASHVALADQDDAWHPDKLATLLAELGDAQLVYSDARVVDGDGRVLADTYWGRRSNNHSDLLSLLVANSVTGAASLFPAALLEDALPFPPAQFAHFHDHWLALVALSLGDIAFVERPLYDYVQHGGATLGHAAANRMPGMRERLDAVRRDPRERIRLWRMHYYVDVCRLLQFTAILRLRCGRGWRRASAARSSASSAPTARSPRWRRWPGAARRSCSGRRRDTLGAEWMLAHALRLAAAADRHHARRADPLRAPRLAAAARLRPAARRPRAGRAGGARDRREDRAAAAGGERRRAAAGQPAHPLDRPRSTSSAATSASSTSRGGWRRAASGCGSSPSTRSARCRRAGGATSRPTAGWPGCSTRSRSCSGASRRGSR